MKRKAPAMQLYVKDAVTDTGHLPPEVFKGLWMLTFKAWAGVEGQEQGYLPSDETLLQEMSGLDARAWRRVGPRVLGFLGHSEDGRYYSKRGLAELRKLTTFQSEEWSAKSSDAGKRSARLRSARRAGTHTDEQWTRLVQAVDWMCVRCGARGDLTKDHVIPLYQGGSDRIENLQPLCGTCNCAKGPERQDYVEPEVRLALGQPANQTVDEWLNGGLTKAKPKPTSSSALPSSSDPVLFPAPNGSDSRSSCVVGPSDRRALEREEIEWRMEEVWRVHLLARERYFVSRNGRAPQPPEFTTETKKAIRDAIKEHDRSRLSPEDRERWKKESPVRAAGIGIFLSSWHTGEDQRSTGKFLEPWRPWKHQRSKPDPVPGFAQLYFEERSHA